MTPTDKLRESLERIETFFSQNHGSPEHKDWQSLWRMTKPHILSLLLSERTRLEGLLPREKAMEMGFDLDAMSHCGQPTTRISKLSQRDIGFNACLREVRELFGEKETPQ